MDCELQLGCITSPTHNVPRCQQPVMLDCNINQTRCYPRLQRTSGVLFTATYTIVQRLLLTDCLAGSECSASAVMQRPNIRVWREIDQEQKPAIHYPYRKHSWRFNYPSRMLRADRISFVGGNVVYLEGGNLFIFKGVKILDRKMVQVKVNRFWWRNFQIRISPWTENSRDWQFELLQSDAMEL